MKYLSGTDHSFILECSAPVNAAKTDPDSAGAKAIGECADIRFDCGGGK
jgi:hypothetical protein